MVSPGASGSSAAHSRAICSADNSRACSTNNRAFARSISPAHSAAATSGSRLRSCSARSCSANAAPVVIDSAGAISWIASTRATPERATTSGPDTGSQRPTSAIAANNRACWCANCLLSARRTSMIRSFGTDDTSTTASNAPSSGPGGRSARPG